MDTSLLDKAPAPLARSSSLAHATASRGAPGAGTRLGSRAFRQAHGVRLAYTAGAMYRGIASAEMVVAMARAGLLSFLGAGGLSHQQLSENLERIKEQVGPDTPWGVNLIAQMEREQNERDTVSLLLRHGVRVIEASAFVHVTAALVHWRLSGLERGADGRVVCRHRVIAKLSRPEVARSFMSPAPDRLVQRLLAEGVVTERQAALAKEVAIADDVCVEADSGGHTDQGVALVMLPAIKRLRDELGWSPEALRVGLAGGIGTPEAVAAAFILGADFVTTGSINQCTVESGAHPMVKALLQDIDIHDTTYAPAADMFELGAKVQVLKKGVFFPARANRLHALWSQHDALDAIPLDVRKQLEEKYFRQPLETVWAETRRFFLERGRDDEVAKAESQPKHKMALVFRWYFGHSMRAAFAGDPHHRLDFQVHTGPALGAFNRWVKGTPWEDWQQRHVDRIADRLMDEAAGFLEQRLRAIECATA